MKDSSVWMQRGEAEEGGVQAEGLEPGLEQWDGKEGWWEKRDSLRIDRGSRGIQEAIIMQPLDRGF